jgi:hypothetical protein
MRRPTLLFLALILALWAAPSFAQAAPAGPAVAPAARPAALPDGSAALFLSAVLASPVTCPAASSPLPEPQIQCFRCPVGLVSCGLPTCRCCRVATADCCQ